MFTDSRYTGEWFKNNVKRVLLRCMALGQCNGMTNAGTWGNSKTESDMAMESISGQAGRLTKGNGGMVVGAKVC